MKKIILIIILIISLPNVHAQQYPPVKDGSSTIEAKAQEITNAYDKQVAMTAKQRALFKLKVEDYLIKRNEIVDAYEGKEELDMLTELQVQETLDMNDILTGNQMDVYKRIKSKIQPLKVVGSQSMKDKK